MWALGEESGLYFFLAGVLEYAMEFPLNLLCNIIFSMCSISSAKSPVLCMALSRKAVLNFQNHVHTCISIHKQRAPFSSTLGPTSGVPARMVLLIKEKELEILESLLAQD